MPTTGHERGDSAPAAMGSTGGGAGGPEELKTRSLPTRCLHGARPLLARRTLLMGAGESGQGEAAGGVSGGGGGGGGGSAGLLLEEDGFYYSQPLLDERDEDLYGSSEDLAGHSILEKLMVWAYYTDEDSAIEDDADDLPHGEGVRA